MVRVGGDRARRWWGVVAVFAVAVLVRLVFLYTALDSGWPHSLYYEGDAPVWVAFAASLDSGVPFESDLPIRSPGVAYLLHVLGSVGEGYDFVGFKTLWCVLSAAAVAVCFSLVRSQLGIRVALMAAGMSAFSFGSYVVATSLNGEAVYTFVLMVALAGTWRLWNRPSYGLACGVGVAHGLAALLRAEHTLLVVMLSVWVLVAWWWRGGLVPRTAIRGLRGGSAGMVCRRRAVGLTVAMLVAFVVVCLPWSVRGSLATVRFNRTADGPVRYEEASLPWTAEARAFVDGFPAFARGDNVAYLTHLCAREGATVVTLDRARSLLLREFGYVPEPLDPWVFVSSQGAFSFALANHPDGDGGFSKVGLDDRFGVGARLHLALPSHLRLYNHGYSVGFGYVCADAMRWLRLVWAKLGRFADGLTLGFTAYDWPYGLGGVRWAVDVLTPESGSRPMWRFGLLLVGFYGATVLLRRPGGAMWVLVMVYKTIVTVLFYGYARQAVSVLPVFFVLVAVGLDAVYSRVGRWVPVGLGVQVAALGVVTIALVGIDVHAGAHVSPARVTGVFARAPRWGEHAIESFERIEIRPAAIDRGVGRPK